MAGRRRVGRIATALVLASLVAACGPSDARQQEDEAGKTTAQSAAPVALTVAVETVAERAIGEDVVATGTVEAFEEITISAETSGLAVVEVAVAEGDRVAKGQLLARLNDRLLVAKIASQDADIGEAAATLAQAEVARDRGRTLVAKTAISKETAEDRETSAKTAAAKLAKAKAERELLEAELAQTRILAPAAGIVSAKPVPVGTVVQVGTTLFTLIREGRLEVAANVPEAKLDRVRATGVARVTGASGVTVDAKVRAIAETVASDTRLGTVYVALPANSGFRQGMFARIAFDLADRPATTVAETALVWRDGQPAVFVVGADDVVTAAPVVTGARVDGRVEIVEGLKAGSRVVTAGAGFLEAGDRVAIADAPPSAAGPVLSYRSGVPARADAASGRDASGPGAAR